MPTPSPAESAVPDSVSLMQAAFDAASAHIAILDEHGTIIKVNAAWDRFARTNGFHNYRHGVGENYLGVCDAAAGRSAEGAAAVAQGIRAVLAGQCAEFVREYPCHRLHEERWFIARVTRFESGDLPRLLVAHENITPRKQMEEALRAKEQRLRLALIAGGLGAFEHIPEQKRILVSPEFCRIFEIPIREFLTEEVWTGLLHPDDRKMVLANMQWLRREQTGLGFEHRICGPRGATRWIRTMAAPVVANGTVERIHGVVEDITHRKQAETELRQFSRVVEQSPVSVVITDLRGTIEYVNPKFCAVTGYSVEEVRGKNPRVLKSGEMAGESYQKLWATITNGQEWRGEFHNRKKNGELFWESASIGPVRDANGKTTHFIAIKEDITTRKRALEDLAEAKQFLDQIIDTVGDPLFVKDRRHRWVMMNAANCALIGHTRQELLGKTNRDFFPPEEADRFWARDEEVFNTGRESIHEEIITDGAGNVHIVQTHKNLYRNEQGDQFIVGVLRDITQGKKLEAALRESEHRQRAVLDNIPDPAWLRDREGRFLMVNRAWCNVAGITPADAVGKTVVEVGVFPPEIARNIQAEDEEVISLGTSSQRELQLNSKNHGPVWFETLKTALVDERGTIVGLVGIARDITDRKRADAVQKEQIALRERLAKVAMNAPGVIYSLRLRLDGSACMPYVSPTVEEFYGVRAEEVMENAALVFTLVHPDDQAQIRESILESARQMAPWRAEFRVNHPRKGLFWVGNRSTPEREIDGGTLWHGFMSDITERKRAEEALRESEEKFRQLADNTTDVFWICSPDFKTIHYVSAGYELIWGVSRESLYAHPHQWREAILPEERVRLATVFARLQGNASTVSVEYPITRRDGTVRWIHDRGFQVRDAAGNLIRLAGIASDITEQRRAAQELAERKESEELVRCELAHEHALNMIKSRFVSMVSHEFRTPLCAINMAAFMLTDYGEGMPGEERMEHARTIQRSVGRMTGMMEDFLTHDRVQTGKSECTPAWMNVESFCQELVPEVVNPLSPNRLVDLSIEPAAREAWLDEKILRHILTNLLSNAVKYSGDRQPVTIEVKRMEDGIPTSGGPRSAARDGLQFRVTDAGIGIPEADLGKLYQTFHRAANVGNRPGTGMGLAIVKQFVDLHGGTIRVESHVGQGTTFWVWLPAVALTMPGKAAAAVPAGESKEAGINGK